MNSNIMGSGPFLIHSATNNIIPFNGVSVFTIGRSGGCNLDIAAIYISRKQCRIENLRNVGWVLFDESRFKTTKLNNEPIGTNYAILKDGDKITFSANSGSHEYIFHCDEDIIERKRRRLDNELTQTNQDIIPNNERLSPLDLLREMATQSSFSVLSPKRSQSDEVEKLKKEKLMLEIEIRRSRGNLESNNRTVLSLQTEKESLLKRIEEVECNNKRLLETLSKMKDSTENDSGLNKESLQEEVTGLKTKLEEMGHKNNELKEAITDAEVEIDSLLKERCCKIIKFGSDSKNKESASMDTLTEVEMSLMKEDLRELTKKNSDLTLNLEKLTSEKEMFSVKVNEILDSELCCSICSDLIYQAITLQCKHTFCKMCIDEWKKKKRDCPVCRTKIKTQLPCLVVDNFIDKVADAMGGEMKSRRQDIIKERTEAAAAMSSTKGTKRKRAPHILPVSPHYRDLFDRLDIGYVPPTVMEEFLILPNYPEVVDLTGSAPILNYNRGRPAFERLGRRRYR